MTRKFQIIISASAATVLAYSALAQDTSNLKTGGPIYARDHEQCLNRLNGAAKASHFIGMAVRNNQNEKLGKVEDFAVDVQSGRIVQVILSSGGFIGVGNKLTAVPSQALHCDVAHKVLRLDADKDKLKGGPKFEMSKWAEYSDSNHLAEVYGYYDEQPAFRFIQSGDAIADGQRNADALPNMVLTRKPAGKWDKDRLAQGSQCMIPESRLGQVQKASKLMGTPVKNKQDENLGKVENLLVDLPAGRVVAIIISSGGFLGIDDELSAVPPTALRFSVMEVELLDLNEVVAHLLKMLGRLIGEQIVVRFDRREGLPAVEGDGGMIEQVIMNLAVNARDAMPKGGVLAIGVESIFVGPDRVKDKLDVQPGQFLCLSVADNGCGMDEATRQRIFEPFFTTKDPGKGTGLGLATVHGIVAQHKGWVEVTSEVGKGTTFRVFLPASAKLITKAPAAEKIAAMAARLIW